MSLIQSIGELYECGSTYMSCMCILLNFGYKRFLELNNGLEKNHEMHKKSANWFESNVQFLTLTRANYH